MRTIALVILTVGGVAAFGAARVAADTDGQLSTWATSAATG